MIYNFKGNKYIASPLDPDVTSEKVCTGCAFRIARLGAADRCNLSTNKYRGNELADKMTDDCVERDHLYKILKLYNKRKLKIQYSEGPMNVSHDTALYSSKWNEVMLVITELSAF